MSIKELPKFDFVCAGTTFNTILVRNMPNTRVDEHWDTRPDLFLIMDQTQSNLDKGMQPGEPCTEVSRYLQFPFPAKGCMFVKNYSENEGILEALVEAGWIEETGSQVNSGFVVLPECRIKHPEKIPTFDQAISLFKF